jgi:hypothetical protein
MEKAAEKLTRRQAAQYLWEKYRARTSPATLAKMASRGDGPQYRYFGKFAIYEEPDLDAWAVERLTGKVHSTAGRPDPRDSTRRLGRQRIAMRV